MGWDTPIGAEIGREFKLGEMRGLGETLIVGRLVGITGDEYSVFCVVWVIGSPEGWEFLIQVLGGVAEGGSKLFVIFEMVLGTCEGGGRADTGRAPEGQV